MTSARLFQRAGHQPEVNEWSLYLAVLSKSDQSRARGYYRRFLKHFPSRSCLNRGSIQRFTNLEKDQQTCGFFDSFFVLSVLNVERAIGVVAFDGNFLRTLDISARHVVLC